MGLGRSTMGGILAAQCITFYRKDGDYILKRLEEAQVRARSMACQFTSYHVIHTLLRLIRQGLECKLLVDELVDIASTDSTHSAHYLNIREEIEQYRQVAMQVDTGSSRERHVAIRRGIQFLKRYAVLIVFQSYLAEIASLPNELSSPLSSFTEWMSKHGEIDRVLQGIDREHGLDSIEPAEGTIIPGQGFALSNEVWNVVKGRRGSVLASMTVLKDDHFPGSGLLEEDVQGAPNHRTIAIKDTLYAVHGVAIPLVNSIPLVLNKCQAPIIWVNLREEPLVYINGHPFVLRVVKDPLNNLEMTGILSHRVEQMEERLAQECTMESVEFGGKVLVHGEQQVQEIITSNSKPHYTVAPEWIEVETIQTPVQVFGHLVKTGALGEYHRLPITDEQAPIPEVFDYVNGLVKGNPKGDFVYNCQMGRGRTTTFLVTTLLIKYVTNMKPNLPPITYSDPYKAGEYKLIISLLRLLPQGKEAKLLTDWCIDQAGHVQNLRECIREYIKTLRGLNYLIRYFYLIVFASYLMDQSEKGTHEGFVHWLETRREIGNLVAKRDQIDISIA